MIDLIPYILILLTISTVALSFIIRVIIKQRGLYKYEISDNNVRYFRDILLIISLTVLVMGLIPMGINIHTLFDQGGRPDQVQPISFIYSLTVHLQTLLLSYLLWRIYRLAGQDFNDS